MKKGMFLAFEGIDGSGKSTQIQLIIKRLRQEGHRVFQTCEPSGGPVGSLIRQILTGRIEADSRVIAALFAADRLDHLLNNRDGIMEKLNNGITVVTDRYYFSSYAYHSVDVPMDWVIAANEESAKILRPDMNIFLDVDVDTAMDRINSNRFHQELFEKKSYLKKVKENYHIAFKRFEGCEDVLIVDGNNKEEEIADVIWDRLKVLGE